MKQSLGNFLSRFNQVNNHNILVPEEKMGYVSCIITRYFFIFSPLRSVSCGKKGCNKYGNLCRSTNSALHATGKTRLDRERAKMCKDEVVSFVNSAPYTF